MSSSISGLAAANEIAAPTNITTDPNSSEFQAAAGNPNLQIDGNAIDTGRYLIIASTASTHGASSNADDGQVTIFDKQTDTYVNVWGDPHVTASDGNQAEFQQDGLTINLADGTQVEFSPTALSSSGVAHIQDVAVTKNGQTVGITNFEGQAGTSPTFSSILQGPASTYSSTMDNTFDTVLTAGKTDIGAFTFTDGTLLNSTSSQMDLDGIGGGMTEYYDVNDGALSSSASAAIVSATTGGTTVATAQAASSITLPADVPGLISSLETAVSSSTILTPAQQVQAMRDLTTISTAVAANPAPAAGASDISQLNALLNSAAGSSQFAVGPTVTEVPNATTIPGMLTQLAMVAQTLPSSAQSAISDVTTLLTLPPPVIAIPAPSTSTTGTSTTGTSTTGTSTTTGSTTNGGAAASTGTTDGSTASSSTGSTSTAASGTASGTSSSAGSAPATASTPTSASSANQPASSSSQTT